MKGRVDCIGHKNGCFKTYVAQSYFGDIEVLQKIPRLFSTKAASDCNLLMLNSKVFESILNMYPDLCQQLMHKSIKRFLCAQFSIRRFECFSGITKKDGFWSHEKEEQTHLHKMLGIWLNLVEVKAAKDVGSME